MKNYIVKFVLSISVGMLMLTANAASVAATKDSTTNASADVLRFDTYVVVAGYTALPNQAVMATTPVTNLGQLNIYANPAQAMPSQLTQHAVVRNIATGELGLVTGRLVVFTERAALIEQAVQSMGLVGLKSLDDGKVLLLEAPRDADLLQISQHLSRVAGVKLVKIDVLEQINTPQ